MTELAVAGGEEPVKADDVATRRDIPAAVLLNILTDLHQAQLARSAGSPRRLSPRQMADAITQGCVSPLCCGGGAITTVSVITVDCQRPDIGQKFLL